MKGSRGERVLGGRVLGLWGILKRGEYMHGKLKGNPKESQDMSEIRMSKYS